jgi:hypothetical protein
MSENQQEIKTEEGAMKIAFHAIATEPGALLPMIGEATRSPDGKLFLIYTNHQTTALGCFLDESLLEAHHPEFPGCDAFYPEPIPLAGLQMYPASMTGHNLTSRDAALQT